MSSPLSNLHPCPHQDLQSNSHHCVDLEGRRKQHYHCSLPFLQPASEAGGKSGCGASKKRGGSNPDPCHEPAGEYIPNLLLLDGRSNPMSACGAPEGWHQHWKSKTLVRNFCTPAALCASSIKSRHPEDGLPGWSCSMAKASVPTSTLNPSALGHHPSPGRATVLGKISPVVLWCLHASTAINQAAMDGINSPASAREREGKGMNCKQGGPHAISYLSACLAPCLATTLLPFLYRLLSFFYQFFSILLTA